MTEFKSGVDLTLMEGVLRQYQEDSTSLIMILQRAQAIYGYLPQEVIYHVAERTGNSPAKVLGVATFYSYFRLSPMGTYQIMLCQGTACHVNGAERIRTAITQELGILNGETKELIEEYRLGSAADPDDICDIAEKFRVMADMSRTDEGRMCGERARTLSQSMFDRSSAIDRLLPLPLLHG